MISIIHSRSHIDAASIEKDFHHGLFEKHIMQIERRNFLNQYYHILIFISRKNAKVQAQLRKS